MGRCRCRWRTTRLLDSRFFESYYRLRPVNATFTGIHDYDHRLPDWSPDGLAAALDEMQRAARRARCGAAPPASLASRRRRARSAAGDLRSSTCRSPSTRVATFSAAIRRSRVGEAIFGVIALMTRPFAPVARARRAPPIARLTATAGLPRRRAAVDRRPRCPTNGAPSACASARAPAAARRRHPPLDRGRAHRRSRGRQSTWPRRGRGRRRRRRVRDVARAATRRPRRRSICVRPRSVRPAARRAATGATGRAPALAADARAGARRSARRALDERARADRARRLARGAAAPDRRASGPRRLSAGLSARLGRLPRARGWRAISSRGRTTPIRYVPIPVHTRDAAPFLYYLFYRSPAPFDRLPVHDYVVTPIDAGCRRRAAAAAARDQHERDQAEPRRSPRRDRTSRAELLRVRGRVGDRPRRRGRLRQPDRHVPRRHDGGRVGLLRDRPDGRSRVLHARGIGRPAAHARAPAGARGRRHRPARAVARASTTRSPSIAIGSACRRMPHAARRARIRCFPAPRSCTGSAPRAASLRRRARAERRSGVLAARAFTIGCSRSARSPCR